MAIEFRGGGPEDPAPVGVVAKFMLATANRDQEAAIELLAETSREGMELHDDPMDAAVGISHHFGSDFAPEPEELTTEEWAEGSSRCIQTLYGNADQGYSFTQTQTQKDDYASVNLKVAAYGLPQGQEFSVVWAKSLLPEQEPEVHLTVTCQAPQAVIDSMGATIESNCEVLKASEY